MIHPPDLLKGANMSPNVGRLDRLLRVIIAFMLFALFFLPGDSKWFGLIGFIPLLTVLGQRCPLYSLLGISTCGSKQPQAGKSS